MTNVERHAPGTPSWFDLMTPDLDSARAFYGALFGWTFEVGPAEAHHYTMCKIGDRSAAGIGQKPAESPFPSSWNVYFAVESCDDTSAEVKTRDGQVVMGPMDVFDAGRLAFCIDPTGAAFGLWQPRAHKGAGIAERHGAMAWCEVNTPDATKAVQFYGPLFGLEPRKLVEMTATDYYTLHKGDKTACGVLQMTADWAGIPPHWMAYFAVDDVEASAKQVQSLGGKVHHGPFDTPYGRIAVISDPAGAMLSILQPPK